MMEPLGRPLGASVNDLQSLYQSGSCRGMEWDGFFADPPPGKPAEVPESVARICAACPVRQTCLDWALAHDEWGVWAGTSRKVRESLARGIRRAKCPACADSRLWTTPTRQVCAACGLSWDASREHSQSARRQAATVAA